MIGTKPVSNAIDCRVSLGIKPISQWFIPNSNLFWITQIPDAAESCLLVHWGDSRAVKCQPSASANRCCWSSDLPSFLPRYPLTAGKGYQPATEVVTSSDVEIFGSNQRGVIVGRAKEIRIEARALLRLQCLTAYIRV